MLDIDAGLPQLEGMVPILEAVGTDLTCYHDWCERRRAVVAEELRRLGENAAVADFIEDYASAQAQDIQGFIVAAEFELAGDILVDLMEELLRQARRYSQRVTALPESVPGAVSEAAHACPDTAMEDLAAAA